jgi:hypothetical protein
MRYRPPSSRSEIRTSCKNVREKLDLVVRLSAIACLLVAASLARAGQPIFISTPPVISTQAQGPVRSSADLNQASMSQIINQLNQRQFQLSVAAAQASAQRTVFVPRTINVKRAK